MRAFRLRESACSARGLPIAFGPPGLREPAGHERHALRDRQRDDAAEQDLLRTAVAVERGAVQPRAVMEVPQRAPCKRAAAKKATAAAAASATRVHSAAV